MSSLATILHRECTQCVNVQGEYVFRWNLCVLKYTSIIYVQTYVCILSLAHKYVQTVCTNIAPFKVICFIVFTKHLLNRISSDYNFCSILP